ncbi:MAG: AI-2E family transporter [Coleofasciculaceae cyanobacterium]
MKLTKRLPRWLVLGLAYPLLFLNGWLLILTFDYFHSIIAILITATLLAFVLDYPVQLLRRWGVRRTAAVIWVFLLTLLISVVLGLTLVPIAIAQLNELIVRLPSWIKSGSQQLQAFNDWAETRQLPINFKGVETQLSERFSGQLQAFIGEALRLLLNTASQVLDVFATVILTFYLVLHGEKLWNGIFQWLPSKYTHPLRGTLRQKFHNYFVGQATLATLMGVSMTIAFLVLQVPLSLLFGLAIGVMSLFPFGGALSITLVSLLIAFKSFWLGVRVLLVATLIDQVVENGVAPRLLGGFTGLNPVWILVALLVGAKLMGILGLLIAVPLAASIKSIAHELRAASSSASTLTSPLDDV